MPELSWYTAIEIPLDSFTEGTYPFDSQVSDDDGERVGIEMVGNMSALKLGNHIKVKNPVKMKRVRKLSMSSSEPDEDINKMLEEVVRDYTATHSRTTRPAEGPTKSRFKGIVKAKDEVGKGLIYSN